MVAYDYCEHGWPGSGCRECKRELEAEKVKSSCRDGLEQIIASVLRQTEFEKHFGMNKRDALTAAQAIVEVLGRNGMNDAVKAIQDRMRTGPDAAAYQAAWNKIGADPQLARARRVLSMHELRTIIRLAYEAAKPALAGVEAIAGTGGVRERVEDDLRARIAELVAERDGLIRALANNTPSIPAPAQGEAVAVHLSDIKQWRKDWLEENDPKDGTDCVTPFDAYLYRSPAATPGAKDGLDNLIYFMLSDDSPIGPEDEADVTRVDRATIAAVAPNPAATTPPAPARAPEPAAVEALRRAFDELRCRMLRTTIQPDEPVIHIFDRCVEAQLAGVASPTTKPGEDNGQT